MAEVILIRVEPTDIPCAACGNSMERALYGDLTPDGVRAVSPFVGCRPCGVCEIETPEKAQESAR